VPTEPRPCTHQALLGIDASDAPVLAGTLCTPRLVLLDAGMATRLGEEDRINMVLHLAPAPLLCCGHSLPQLCSTRPCARRWASLIALRGWMETESRNGSCALQVRYA
jgi:hypothetical protein